MKKSDLTKLDQKYRDLTFLYNDGGDGNFLSGWQTNNPFSNQISEGVRRRTASFDASRYAYFGTQTDLADRILSMHSVLDGIAPNSVQCGSGATSLMYCWIKYIKNRGIREVYYIPPLYLTMYNALLDCGIKAIPLSRLHAYESDFDLDLPLRDNAVLLLVDPIWYCGVSVPASIIDHIRHWQDRCGAQVFVDGSMQYMSWEASSYEATANLNPNLTTRLVCPAKQLCMNGYRFAYLLGPTSQKQEIAWMQTNTVGSASIDSIAFGHEAMEIIEKRSVVRELMIVAASNYAELIKTKIIHEYIKPNCTYYTFAKISAGIKKNKMLLNGEYYQKHRAKDKYKINLLSPSLPI